MVKGDTFTVPINFALQETMKRFENSDDVNDKIIYEGLRRSKCRRKWKLSDNEKSISKRICEWNSGCRSTPNSRNNTTVNA